MWWLGSLPWAYWPIRPVMSAWSRPQVSLAMVKSESSTASQAASPPSISTCRGMW